MALRVCSVPGCPRLQPETRCAEHRREADRKRGSSTARGYGSKHQAERKRWLPIVRAGRVTCARCDKPIRPDEAWDLGHDDCDRTRYTGPEHVRCNRATNGR